MTNSCATEKVLVSLLAGLSLLVLGSAGTSNSSYVRHKHNRECHRPPTEAARRRRRRWWPAEQTTNFCCVTPPRTPLAYIICRPCRRGAYNVTGGQLLLRSRPVRVHRSPRLARRGEPERMSFTTIGQLLPNCRSHGRGEYSSQTDCRAEIRDDVGSHLRGENRPGSHRP